MRVAQELDIGNVHLRTFIDEIGDGNAMGSAGQRFDRPSERGIRIPQLQVGGNDLASVLIEARLRIGLAGLQIQSLRRELGKGCGLVPLNFQSLDAGEFTLADSKRHLNVPSVLDDLGLHLNVGIAGIAIICRQVADAAIQQVVAEFTVGQELGLLHHHLIRKLALIEVAIAGDFHARDAMPASQIDLVDESNLRGLLAGLRGDLDVKISLALKIGNEIALLLPAPDPDRRNSLRRWE